MQFGFSRRKVVRPPNKPRRGALTRRPLAVDCLEDRRMLSAGSLDALPAWTAAPVSGESVAQQANTVQNTTNGSFYYPNTFNGDAVPAYVPSPRSVATFGDGSSVVAWADVQSGDLTHNLMMQQYGPGGNAIGSPIAVAAGNNVPEIMVAAQQTAQPSNFVIAWPQAMTTSKGSLYKVTHAEVWQFGNSGVNGGPTLEANTTIGSSSASFLALSVAMDAGGNFDLLTDAGSVQRFNSAAVAQGAPIAAATPHQPLVWGPLDNAIAMAPTGGDFVVSWNNTVVTKVIKKGVIVSTDYVDHIYAEKFDANGNSLTGGPILVKQGDKDGDHLAQTDVAMDATGGFVVSWRDAYVHQVGDPATVWGSVWADVFHVDGTSTGPIDAVPLDINYGGAPNGSTIVYNAVVPYEVPAVMAQSAGGGAFDLAWTAFSQVYDDNTSSWISRRYVYSEQFSAVGAPSSQGPITVYQTQPYPDGKLMTGYVSASVDANNDLLVVYSLKPTDAPPTGFTSASGDVFTQFYANQRFNLTVPSNVSAGTPFDVTVTANSGYTGTVHFTSSDGQAMLPADAALTDGMGTFTVTLKTAGDQTVTASDTADSLFLGSATVNVAPAAATHFTLSAPANATVGSPVNVTVVAQDDYGNTATGYTGAVRFTSSDSSAALPSVATLTGGVGTFGVTLNTSGSQTVTGADSIDSSIAGAAALNVVNGATHFTVTTTATSTAGNAFEVTITALDANGGAVTGYTGAVHFTSSDGQAVLPADATLTGGVGTFTVTLKTSGNQTVTATGVDSTGVINGSATVDVAATAASRFILVAPSAVNGGSPFELTVKVTDVYGNVVPNYAGTVTITSGGSMLASGTLTDGVGTFGLVLNKTGNPHKSQQQTITVTDGSITSSIVVTLN